MLFEANLTRCCGLLIVSAAVCLFAGCSQQASQAGVDESSPSTVPQEQASVDSNSCTRHFQFHYRFDIVDLKPGDKARVWLPTPQSSASQQVTQLDSQLPAEATFHTEPKYGNRILYFEAEAPEEGRLSIDVPYHIERREIASAGVGESAELSPNHREKFLQANTKVPVDGKPLELLSGITLSDDEFEMANQLYDLVDQHVAYDKSGTGWGKGDVAWVCDSRYGNCTDFHSLFISLARSQGVPSRFEIGFPIPSDGENGKVGGYHCWAFFFAPKRGWVPVDISEADKHPEMKEYYFGNLTPDRVAFSTGRDILLEPKSNAEPLNYFIYPHVEVSGVALPRAQIALKFSYANQPE